MNPFLGELYLGKWDEPGLGETTLVSEQVSHHPPVTAYCITNEKNRIQLQGYNAQKASFSRTIHVKQIGHALLTLHPPGSEQAETYLITLPALHIENLIYGAPFVECGKFINIVSSTGYVSKIDFSGKGWLSGKKNSFTAFMWKEGQGSENSPLYTAAGQWSDAFTIKEGDAKRGKEIENFKPSQIKIAKLKVAPIEDQDVLESRRAWAKVSQCIERGDMDGVAHYKSRIENAQRALRKKEQEEKRDWDRIFFTQADPKDRLEQTFQGLVKVATSFGINGWEGVAPDKTAGVWRYDGHKALKAKKPFHPKEGLLALGENADGTSAPISRVPTSQGAR